MRVVVATCALIAILVGCGPTEPRAPSPLPLEDGPYKVEPVTNGGVITGHCRLVGEPRPSRLKAWPGMGTESGQDDESVSVGTGQALGGCFVSLAGIAHGKEWPEAMRPEDRTLELSVVPGHYVPHLAWVRAGTQVDMTSSLRMEIHVKMLQDLVAFAIFDVQPGQKLSAAKDLFLSKPGLVHVTEARRRAFNAWILVSTHPYVDVTTAGAENGREPGAYRLGDVPPGDYELVCRHEPMDRVERQGQGAAVWYETGAPIEMRRRIYVRSGERTVVDFEVAGGVVATTSRPR